MASQGPYTTHRHTAVTQTAAAEVSTCPAQMTHVAYHPPPAPRRHARPDVASPGCRIVRGKGALTRGSRSTRP